MRLVCQVFFQKSYQNIETMDVRQGIRLALSKVKLKPRIVKLNQSL